MVLNLPDAMNHVVVVFSLLLRNFNFVNVMSHNANTCVFRWSLMPPVEGSPDTQSVPGPSPRVLRIRGFIDLGDWPDNEQEGKGVPVWEDLRA